MEFDDFFIRKASLFIAATGVIGIFIISVISAPIETEIQKISPELTGKTVSIEGKISRTKILSNAVSFELTKNNAKINAVIFKPNEEELLLIQKGAEVNVTGVISEYNNSLEIIAKEVTSTEE